ncbi:MAG: peptide chain release factor N(5)-glutamine methyltransferase [Acidimicrobiia bacterium]|nr:peptide chain release factor N(5)-glutamine methyltransferase [Acidimicrobiia bacterium]
MTLPAHEHRRLVAAVTGRPFGTVTGAEALDADDRRRLDDLVSRRLAGEPLQHLEGSVSFGPLDLLVDARVLVPRPETEQVFDQAARSLGEAGPGTLVVDLCTGSGALALALKHRFPDARVIGVDVSEDALAVAKENGTRLDLEVEWLHGDLFTPLPKRLMGRVDLLVSNPPYVAEDEWADLPTDVRDHEPRVALVAGPEGTEVLARIAEEAFWWLGVGGWAVCEIGATQGAAAERLFAAYDREVRTDLAGRDRILVARKGAPCCV